MIVTAGAPPKRPRGCIRGNNIFRRGIIGGEDSLNWSDGDMVVAVADEVGVRCDVVEGVAGEGEFDLEMLGVFEDAAEALRSGGEFFGGGEVAEHVLARGG